MPRSRSRQARARSSSMEPSSPAFFSCLAQAVIRWPAARTSAGGSSRPISAALPESSAHRCTRASRAAASRRFLALSGATSMTARAIAARPARGQAARPVQHHRLGLAGLAGVQVRGSPSDDLRLVQPDDAVPQRRPGPGQPHLQGEGDGEQVTGAAAVLGQHMGQLTGGELLARGGHPRGSFGRAARLGTPPDPLAEKLHRDSRHINPCHRLPYYTGQQQARAGFYCDMAGPGSWHRSSVHVTMIIDSWQPVRA